MNILLDENLSKRLARHFPDTHRVSTAKEMGWEGQENGGLLPLASHASYDVLITLDTTMSSEQSRRTVPLPVIVLRPQAQGNRSAGRLIATSVVSLLGRELELGFYEVWHDGRIIFKRPGEKGKGTLLLNVGPDAPESP